MDYKIISDGCCDLEKEIIEQYNLRIIPFYISFDEETYYKEIEEIGIREVYERMVGNQMYILRPLFHLYRIILMFLQNM